MQKLIYSWKQSARLSLDAAVVGEELARINAKGKLTPAKILKEASNKRSPLHGYFEWDDSVAAHKFRLEQSKYLVRNIEVKIIPNKNEPDKEIVIRAFASLGDGIADGKNSQYHSISDVLNNSELRDRQIRKAWNELLSVKHRYQHLVELAAVWNVIDIAQKSVMSA